MLFDLSTEELLKQIDSDSPAPGGGSVSALVSVLGISLARMYAHLSVNKKKFKALDEQVQQEFITCFENLAIYKKNLIAAFDHDCDAYDQVITAYQLPKRNEEEINVRQQAILAATQIAIDSPYAIMKESLHAMRLCAQMVDQGNRNAISDLACGVIFMDAAIQGASLNVAINLAILDEAAKKNWTMKMQDCLQESSELKASILKQIHL